MPRAPAEQQLAVTKAVDYAVDDLKPEIAPHTRVFVDSSYVDTEDKGIVLPKYTIGAVRDLLLRAGANLVLERKDADLVAELRTGAQAVNRKDMLVGVPSFSIPVPMASPPSTPEIARMSRPSAFLSPRATSNQREANHSCGSAARTRASGRPSSRRTMLVPSTSATHL
jgi:hypothetical protein